MLAIVIPFYKLTFFETTLQSLANQTNKEFKVYIGDDASPEDCQSLLQHFIGKFDFLYHRFSSNIGGISLTQQWERCIALSEQEEWIMILGDDDYLEETVVASWYENYNLFYERTKVIRFASKLVHQELNIIAKTFNHPLWENATDSYWRKFTHESRSSLSEYIFSRESFLKFGFYDYPLAWNSDDRAWLDFSDNKPIFTINDSIVYVRLSDLNISGKQDNNSEKNLSVIMFFKFLIKQKLSFYKTEEKEKILRFYESEINKKRDLKFSEWLFLLFFYLRFLDFFSIKKFSKRFFKSILKR